MFGTSSETIVIQVLMIVCTSLGIIMGWQAGIRRANGPLGRKIKN